MKPTNIPLLGYALMGLIHQKPSSGYDLRKVFAETAMGNYSSSPGAIYPALERLETAGLIRGTVEEMGGMRRRKLYHLSPSGLTALKGWLPDAVWAERRVAGFRRPDASLQLYGPGARAQAPVSRSWRAFGMRLRDICRSWKRFWPATPRI